MKTVLRPFFVGLLGVLLVLSVIWGWRSISEYETLRTDYGFPLVWRTEISVEGVILIEGEQLPAPVEGQVHRMYHTTTLGQIWRVSTWTLLFDIIFWTGLIAITAILPTRLPKLRIPKIRITVESPS